MKGMYIIVPRAHLPVPALLRLEGRLNTLSTETGQHPIRRHQKSRLFIRAAESVMGSPWELPELAGETLHGERRVLTSWWELRVLVILALITV